MRAEGAPSARSLAPGLPHLFRDLLACSTDRKWTASSLFLTNLGVYFIQFRCIYGKCIGNITWILSCPFSVLSILSKPDRFVVVKELISQI